MGDWEGVYDLDFDEHEWDSRLESEYRPHRSSGAQASYSVKKRLSKNKKKGRKLQDILAELEKNNGFRQCDHCKELYQPDLRNIKRGWGLCCSKSCAAKRR